MALAQTEIVAISSDDVVTAQKTSSELRVQFPLISDAKRKLINLFGVLHPKGKIARPTVFIIDKKGIVRFRHIGMDYTDRPSIQILLQALAWL